MSNELKREAYNKAQATLKQIIANVKPAEHAEVPLSVLYEEMQQDLCALYLAGHTKEEQESFSYGNQQNSGVSTLEDMRDGAVVSASDS